MTAKLAPLVERAAGIMGATIKAEVRDGLLAWLERLEEWNARIDLTAARSREELVDLMLADALLLAPHLTASSRVVDVGSGAGAPGLPLALLRDDLRVTLVEPSSKRVSFLRTVLGGLARPDVVIERARAEQLAGRAWDVALSRATMRPPEWLALGARLAPGGTVWVLLASDAPPSHPGARLVEDLAYKWPLTGVSRRAAAYRIR